MCACIVVVVLVPLCASVRATVCVCVRAVYLGNEARGVREASRQNERVVFLGQRRKRYHRPACICEMIRRRPMPSHAKTSTHLCTRIYPTPISISISISLDVYVPSIYFSATVRAMASLACGLAARASEMRRSDSAVASARAVMLAASPARERERERDAHTESHKHTHTYKLSYALSDMGVRCKDTYAR
jgi:hypothetical protein